MIDKYGMRVAPQGSYVLERGEPLRFFSSETTHPKKIQITAPQEKYKDHLGPQVSHGLGEGDTPGKSCKLAPLKEKQRMPGQGWVQRWPQGQLQTGRGESFEKFPEQPPHPRETRMGYAFPPRADMAWKRGAP